MKRTDYLLIFLYTVLILAVIIHSIFGLFDFQWAYLLEDLSKPVSYTHLTLPTN